MNLWESFVVVSIATASVVVVSGLIVTVGLVLCSAVLAIL